MKMGKKDPGKDVNSMDEDKKEMAMMNVSLMYRKLVKTLPRKKL